MRQYFVTAQGCQKSIVLMQIQGLLLWQCCFSLFGFLEHNCVLSESISGSGSCVVCFQLCSQDVKRLSSCLWFAVLLFSADVNLCDLPKLCFSAQGSRGEGAILNACDISLTIIDLCGQNTRKTLVETKVCASLSAPGSGGDQAILCCSVIYVV